MKTDYDAMASSYEKNAADSPYNAHYDRPAVLELVGEIAGLRLDAGVWTRVFTLKSFSTVAQILWHSMHPARWCSSLGNVSVAGRECFTPT